MRKGLALDEGKKAEFHPFRGSKTRRDRWRSFKYAPHRCMFNCRELGGGDVGTRVP